MLQLTNYRKQPVAEYAAITRRGRALVAAAATLATTTVSAQTASAQTEPGNGPKVTEQNSPTTQLIQAVHAVNSQVVWASGHGGAVLRTVNGGATWELKPTPAGDSIQFRDVHALNADTAWIMSAGNGKASRIYRTNNGGTSWTLQFINPDSSAFYDCLTFLDRHTGVVFSDASNGRTMILRTANGGETWGLLAPSAVPAPLPNEGGFASSGLCVVSPDANTAFIATGSPGARLFRSRDAGQTWSVENTPFVRGVVAGLTGLAFKDAMHGMAVGANIDKLRTDTSRAVVGITTDAGRTWSMQTRPPLPGALSGVAWVPGAGDNVAVVVGFGGSFVTPDAGKSWTVLNNHVFTGVAAIGRTAWIAGAGGKIIRLDW
jgi:photosystem II stability/assembly factor-like uncharacterized protein